MKRPAEKALAPGSICKLKIGDFNDAVKERLSFLAYTGLGERKSEGFGQLRINWLMRDDGIYELNDFKKQHETRTAMPDFPLPETAQEIFHEVFWFHLTLRVKREALMDHKNYHNLPVNSLLGRLLLVLEKSATLERFLENIAEWKDKKASSGLINCINKDDNLNLGEALMNTQKLSKLIKNLSTEFNQELPVEKTKISEEDRDELGINNGNLYRLYQLYWRIVFREMHKKNQQMEQAPGEGRKNASGATTIG